MTNTLHLPKAPPAQKISEWLAELDSHGIYDAIALAEDFTKSTGHVAPSWPTHSTAATRRAIAARGIGGTVSDSQAPCAYGWEIARTLAFAYVQFQSSKSGRGFEFRDCLQALQEARK